MKVKDGDLCYGLVKMVEDNPKTILIDGTTVIKFVLLLIFSFTHYISSEWIGWRSLRMSI